MYRIQLFLLCIATILSLVCKTPQRTGYMSYEVLAGYDNLEGLFQKISSESPSEECKDITRDDTTYTLTDIKPFFHYSDAKQTNSFVDKFTANVSGGALAFGYAFNYEVTYLNGSTLKGVAATSTILQKLWFTKTLINEKGNLTWKVGTITKLQLDNPCAIERSSPKLPFDDKEEIELLLSGVYEECTPRQKLVPKINKLFEEDLENWIDSEDLLSTTNLKYRYMEGKTIEYVNLPSEFGLTEKGLEWEFLFEVDNYTQTCSEVPTTFDSQYGGHQEYIGMGQVVATVNKALQEGWYDGDLDPSWEINQFQFFMGDLANCIAKAKQHPPSEPFTVNCKHNTSLYSVTVEPYSSSRVYATIPFTCTFTVNGTKIQTLSLGLTMELLFDATKDYLVVTNTPFAGVFGAMFYSHEGYEVTNTTLANHYLKTMVKRLVGTRTLGTNFPISRRGRPSVLITEEYVLIFDSAQP